jgi:hypothetical protein
VGEAVMPLITPPILDKILPAIDYWDKNKESRSGIRPGSDLDPDMLQEVTKGAFLEGLNRLSQKIEMITRMLAESGVKELVLQVHDLLIRHQDQARMVQMRGKWIPVNPQEWKVRTDLTVKVGLGTGNEDEKRQKLSMLAQFQGQVLQASVAAPPPVYEKMYALFEDVAKAMGFDVPDKYAIAPRSQEYAMLQQSKQHQPPNPEMLKIQQQAQAEQAKMQMQAQVDAHRQEVEAQQQAARMQMERELEQFKAGLNMQLEREKLAMQQQTQIAIARINAEAKIDAAQLAGQTTLSTQQEVASDNAVGDAE